MHVIVQGLVQGVGFRYYALRQANSCGVRGFVRNRVDGSVEAEAQGEESALELFFTALRRGPQFAQVREAKRTWLEREQSYSDFTIR